MQGSGFSAEFILAIAAIVSLNCAPSFGADSCQQVFDALTKVVSTSGHKYSTHTASSLDGPITTHEETIYTREKTYLRVNNKWAESPLTKAEILEREQGNRKHGKAMCLFLRTETVNGELADVYSLDNESAVSKEDAWIWILRRTGLPMREEVDVDTGSNGGKSHRSTRYEYGNVRPPM
ncbi:MAG TPA: hypothetical protein VHV29_11035 [Terriglobales bacterium]|jgi:hypothetical protein|nr:hypothetical protein [Terriglobales bacterium]